MLHSAAVGIKLRCPSLFQLETPLVTRFDHISDVLDRPKTPRDAATRWLTLAPTQALQDLVDRSEAVARQV
jgi:hypothetical protein